MAKLSDLKRVNETKNEIIYEYRQGPSNKGHSRIKELWEQDIFLAERDDFANLMPFSYTYPTKRLAIGVGKSARGNYYLKIFVEREDGVAFRTANRIQNKLGEAEIEVVKRIVALEKTERRGKKEARSLRSRVRPLHMGLSVGQAQAGAGTLGAFVQIKSRQNFEQGIGFLSSTSVLAPGERPSLDDWIYQPGQTDAERLTSDFRIGKLINLVEIVRFHPNELDVALASLATERAEEVTGNIIPKGFPNAGKAIGEANSDEHTWLGEPVAKIGRTTGYTEGIVTAVSIDGLIVYRGRENVVYDDVFEIRPTPGNTHFAIPGDSGAMVFTKRKIEPIGLVFAAGTTKEGSVSYACRLDKALAAFNVKLLS